jgi:hypothetical protein
MQKTVSLRKYNVSFILKTFFHHILDQISDFSLLCSARTSRGRKTEENIPLFILSLLIGFYFFLCVIAIFISGGIVEQEEFNIFVISWICVPISIFISIPVMKWVRERYLHNFLNAYWILLAVNSIIFFFCTSILNLSWQIFNSLSLEIYLTFTIIILLPLCNILSIIYVEKIPKYLNSRTINYCFFLGSGGFLNFFGFFPYFQGKYSLSFTCFLISILLSLVVRVIWGLFPRNNKKGLTKAFLFFVDLIAIVLIAIICFDPSLTFNSTHENFYLGPINRIIHGGTMLVDTFCQYGNLNIYLLSLLYSIRAIPLTYQSLNLVISFLFIGQYTFLYFLLKYLIKDQKIVIILSISTILLSFFCTSGVIQSYPSTGPLRFGLVYLLLFVYFLKNRSQKISRYFVIIEYFLIGFAFLWSFETFLYTFFAYAGLCAIESFFDHSILEGLTLFFKRMGNCLLSVITMIFLFTIFTYFRAHAFPNWSIYSDLILSYTPVSGGLGNELIDAWSPWFIICAIYFSSLMYFLYKYFFTIKGRITLEEKIIGYLTFFGIAQFTYYLGRSHPNALFHISIPAIIIFGYWMKIFMERPDVNPSLKSFSKLVYLFSFIFICLSSWPRLYLKVTEQNTGLSIFTINSIDSISFHNIKEWLNYEKSLLHENTNDRHIIELSKLIKQYFPNGNEIPIFLSPDKTNEVLYKIKRVHSFQLSYITEDTISHKNINRLLELPSPIKTGDYMIVATDPNDYKSYFYYGAATQLLDKLCNSYDFEIAYKSNFGVSIVKLIEKDGTPNEYCEIINQLPQYP